MRDVARAIKVAGLSRVRAGNIKAILRLVVKRYGGFSIDALSGMPVPQAKDQLLSMPGVGPKTALCVLLFSFYRGVFPVDTHIKRIAARIGWVPAGTDLVKTTLALEGAVDPGGALSLHLNLIGLGRKVCTARAPQCGRCVLVAECDFGKKETLRPGAKVQTGATKRIKENQK